ncbi:MAG: AraC family transcriptional regulator, partial [Pseudomonadota bacterium]
AAKTGVCPLRSRARARLTRSASRFADQSHLGRVFRRAFGTTPARFRQAWRV